jgi:hypothetical protein
MGLLDDETLEEALDVRGMTEPGLPAKDQPTERGTSREKQTGTSIS